MLFSATLNDRVKDLAELALMKPVRVNATTVNHVTQTLEQEFVKTPTEDLREAVLLSLIIRNYTKRVIIFCATRIIVHRIAILLGLSGMRFAEIHGHLSMRERVHGLTKFQKDEVDFLVATDLASRGLDIVNVETVINFNIPFDTTRYIHRVGRTARMGNVGRAVTIYNADEYSKIKRFGKHCCAKVESKVTRRIIAASAVKQWYDSIESINPDVEEILQEEKIDKELDYANLIMRKSENINKYRKDILGRPEREWFQTTKEKREAEEEEFERMKEIAAKEDVTEKTPKPKPDAAERKKISARERWQWRRQKTKDERKKEFELSRTLGKKSKCRSRYNERTVQLKNSDKKIKSKRRRSTKG